MSGWEEIYAMSKWKGLISRISSKILHIINNYSNFKRVKIMKINYRQVNLKSIKIWKDAQIE